MNADEGRAYLFTFPGSIGNVPEMKVLGNVLDASFWPEFVRRDLTADILFVFDASSVEMQHHLESTIQ